MQTNELILDYDDFKVWYDHLNQNYEFQSEHDDPILVEPIGTPHYNVINDCKAEEPQLCSLFDNFCCGEQVTDDEIIYYWFKEIEEVH